MALDDADLPAVRDADVLAPSGAFARLPVSLRPDPALLKLYALSSLLAGPAFFVPLTFLWFRYRSLRYDVDVEGITMRWGVLFRREVSLNYARIQDIHLSSNVLERWLGLAKIQVQTASGAAGAEMTIEGLRRFAAMRDYLYGRMRGSRDDSAASTTVADVGSAAAVGLSSSDPSSPALADLTAALREVAAEIRALRDDLDDPSSDRV